MGYKNEYAKIAAQDALMPAMKIAFVKASDAGMENDDPIVIEMRKQFLRVEKFFGYDKGSWK